MFYIYSENFLIDYLIVDVYPEKKSSYPENFRILMEEDIGIEPNTLMGTSRLAGGPYHHQGLSSIECGTPAVVGDPTQFIPLFVLMTGYDPITSCVSDKCSTN